MDTTAPRIERLAGLLLTLACAGAVLGLVSLPPVLQPDSAGYIARSVERGVIYPLILDAFRSLFGGAYLVWTARIQGLCIVYIQNLKWLHKTHIKHFLSIHKQEHIQR